MWTLGYKYSRRHNKVVSYLYPNIESPWILQLQMQIDSGVLVDDSHSMGWVANDDMLFHMMKNLAKFWAK